MHRNLIWTIVIILVAGIASSVLIGWMQNKHDSELVATSENLSEVTDQAYSASDVYQKKDPEVIQNSGKPALALSPAPLWDAGKNAQSVTLERAHPIHAQRVELDMKMLRGLGSGDTFSVVIPQAGINMSANVIEKRFNQHSETLLAEALVDESAYAIQITVAGDSVFANIESPEGVFIVEQQPNILEGSAVIFAENEIYKNLDYQETDAFPVPP